ncbi:putative NADPH dehydrogenase C5H10.04 [Bienertia sinuspersici]
MDSIVSLKFWHGGTLKKNSVGLQYMGGTGKTFQVDADELCWWFLEQLVKKCGPYKSIETIYYLIPGESLDVGLRKVYDDDEVREMGKVALKYRSVELYVQHSVDVAVMVDDLAGPSVCSLKNKVSKPSPNKVIERTTPITRSMTSPTKPDTSNRKTTTTHPNVITESSPVETTKKQNTTPHPNVSGDFSPVLTPNTLIKPPPARKLTPRPKKTQSDAGLSINNLEDYSDDCYDDRPESPLPFNELIGVYSSDEGSDELYEPEHEDCEDEDFDDEDLSDIEDLNNAADLNNTVPDPQGTEFQQDIDEDLERVIEGDEGDTSDEEFQKAREGLRGFNSNLWQIVSQLQKEAEEGELNSQKSNKRKNKETGAANKDSGNVSEYEDSEEECNTPEGSDDEGIGAIIRKDRKVVASDKIDYSTFEWQPDHTGLQLRL